MKLILFDADGTLVDSQAIIHEAMARTFQRFDYDLPPIEATRSIIGLTLDQAIATMLDRNVDDEVLAMTSEYKDIYLQIAPHEEFHSKPFDGMPELVRKLAREEDILLGIVTGKSRRGVNRLVATKSYENAFVVSRCADDCPSKPHPAMVVECCEEVGITPANTLVIGDTGFDMEMATSARSASIGVSWGYHSEDRMRASGADRIVHTSAGLEDAIVDWRGKRSARKSKRFSGVTMPSFAITHA